MCGDALCMFDLFPRLHMGQFANIGLIKTFMLKSYCFFCFVFCRLFVCFVMFSWDIFFFIICFAPAHGLSPQAALDQSSVMDDIEEWLCADVVRLLYLDFILSVFVSMLTSCRLTRFHLIKSVWFYFGSITLSVHHMPLIHMILMNINQG